MTRIVDPFDQPQSGGIVDPFDTPAAAPTLKDQAYKVFNALFREDGSVMENVTEPTGQAFDPVATAQIDRAIAQPRVRALPDALPTVGVLEKGVRGGVAQLGKAGTGAVQMAADALNMPVVSDFAAGASRRASNFGANPLQPTQIEGFAPNSIVQDLPAASAGAISSVVSNLPALVAGVLAPGAALPMLGAQSVAGEYTEGRAGGLTPSGALLRAVPMGVAEVAGEKLGGFNAITAGIRRGIDEGSLVPIGRAMLASGVRETPSELATTAAQFGVDKLPGVGLNQDATGADLMQQLKDTALQTIIQSGGMAGVGSAIAGPDAQTTAAQPAPKKQATAADIAAVARAIAETATIDSKLAKPSADAFLDDDPLVAKDIPAQPAPDLIGRAETAPQIKEEANAPAPSVPDTAAAPVAATVTAGDVPAAAGQPAAEVQPGADARAAEPAGPQEIRAPEVEAQTGIPVLEQNQPVTQADAGSVSASTAGSAQPAPASFELPAQLSERATQLETASEGMRPGDVVAATGKPFATKAAAQKEAKLAGKGWMVKKGGGGFVVRYSPPTEKQIAAGKRLARQAREIDTGKHSMFDAIARLGGLSMDAASREWGFDPAELKTLRSGPRRVVKDTGGLSLDAMAERLAELGYLSRNDDAQHDVSEFFDLFDGELRGSKHYTPEGFENAGREAEASAYEEWLSQQDLDKLDALPEDHHDFIEEGLERYGDALTEDDIQFSADAIGSEAVAEREAGSPVRDAAAEEGNAGNPAEAGRQEAADAGAGARTGDAGQSAFALEGETLDRARARAEREDQQRRADEQRRKQDEQRAQADAMRDDFRLTGSDRAADVGSAYGQGDIFSRDPDADIPFDATDSRLQDGSQFDDVPFSRNVTAGTDPDAIRAAIATDTFNHEVDVYATLADAPAYVREQAEREGADDVEGFFDPRTNRVALIAANLESAERAREVARHELIGHYGLENMVGRELMDKLAARVLQAEKDGNKVIAELGKHVDKTQPGLADIRRGKEIIAVMAERNVQNSITKRVLDAIRAFLKQIGFLKSDVTDAEIAKLLRMTQEYLALAGREMVAGEAAPAFSRSGAEPVVLELDLPLSSQTQGVRRALSKEIKRLRAEAWNAGDPMADMVDQTVSGRDLVERIIERLGSEYDARDYLEAIGVLLEPVAQFSRAGEGELDLQQPRNLPSNRDVAGRWKSSYGQAAYDKLADAINPILAKVKLADDAPAAFKQMMRQFQVDQQKALANAKQVAEAGVAALSAEERVLISDIIEKNVAVGDMTPEGVVQLAAQIEAALKQQAKDLVELGMATEDRLLDNYLPRAYRNPLLARITSKDQFVSWYQKAKLRMNGNRLKSRGLIHTVATGDIGRYQKLGWKISSMADGEPIPADLKDALENGAPVPPQYATKDMKVLMWRDFTADERAKMGEIRDGVLRYAMGYTETQRDIAIGRLFKAIAEHDELSSKVNPGGWTRVPDQAIPGTEIKRYGALSGLYVPTYVRDVIERSTQPKGPLMAMYDKAMSFWKEGKTVWNPVSHGNNVVSNVFVMHFAGLNPASPKPWRQTIREYRTKGRFYQEAVDNGLFGTEFASREIQELFLPELTDDLDVEVVIASRFNKVVEFLKKTGKPVAWYRETMQKAYEFEDQFFKLMLFIDRRQAGASIEDAIADTERYIFNYTDIPEGVEKIKRYYSPFFSYTYKAIPMVVHTAMTRPDRLLLPIALLGGANWLAYAVMGGDEEEERKSMPDYLKGNTAIGTPKAIRMPFNIGERPAFMDISRRVPLGDLFDLHNQTGGLAAPAPFMPSHPVFSATMAMLANKDMFTGQDLVKKSDTSWDVAEKRADWLWKQMAPNAPFVPGSWNWDKLMNGMANAFDTELMGYTGFTRSGDAIPLGTAVLDVATGTKIRSFDPQRGMDMQAAAAGRERREIMADIRSAQRNKSMTAEAKAQYIAKKREQLQRVGTED